MSAGGTLAEAGVTLHGALDVVRSIRDGTTDQHARVVAARGDVLFVNGWVLIGGAGVGEVELRVDGAPLLHLVTGYPRDDVRMLHGEAALRSGFRGAVPLGGLALGAHDVELRVGPARLACFRTTPLLIVDPDAAPEASDAVSVAGGADEGASYTIGTMLHVAVRARDDRDGARDAFDAGVIVDDRWFVQGRPDGETFEVLLPTEQLGLGAHALRACAFAGERRIGSAEPGVSFTIDDGL